MRCGLHDKDEREQRLRLWVCRGIAHRHQSESRVRISQCAGRIGTEI